MNYLKSQAAKCKQLHKRAHALAFNCYLRSGYVPIELQEMVEATKSLDALEKYNPNWQSQPRVPSGNPTGGRWTDGSLGSTAKPNRPISKPPSNILPNKPKPIIMAEHKPVMKPAKSLRSSEDCVRKIIGHENFEPHVYPCQAGHPTIGYGHRLLRSETFPRGITREEAKKILEKDMQIAERAVQRYTKVPLSQQQFDALVSFTYNVGGDNYRESTLRHLLNQGKYLDAADQFPRWNKVWNEKLKRHVVSNGLTNRRREERETFLSGTQRLSEETA